MDKIVDTIQENVKVVIYTHTRGYNKTSRAKIFTIVNPCKVTTYYNDNWGYLEFIDPLTDKPAKIKRKKFSGYLILNGTEEPDRIYPGFEGFVDRKKRKAKAVNPLAPHIAPPIVNERLGNLGRPRILNVNLPFPVQYVDAKIDLRQIMMDNAIKDMTAGTDNLIKLAFNDENRE